MSQEELRKAVVDLRQAATSQQGLGRMLREGAEAKKVASGGKPRKGKGGKKGVGEGEYDVGNDYEDNGGSFKDMMKGLDA